MTPSENKEAKPNPRGVAYLDLLGFSDAVTTDPAAAIGLLQDYSDALNIKRMDSRCECEQGEQHPKVARLGHLLSASSFETFLPMSDSLFIASSSPSDLVLQLSNFLWDCLLFRWDAFAYPANAPADETWLPVLFRGGIAWGDVFDLKMPGIVKGDDIMASNLCGKAVVTAVGLEARKLKGPRILLAQEFVAKVQGDAKAYIVEAPDVLHASELLWPMTVLETATSIQDALSNQLREMIWGIAGLLFSHIADHDLGAHYSAFLKLAVRSAANKYPDDHGYLRKEVANLLSARLDSASIVGSILDKAFNGEP